MPTKSDQKKTLFSFKNLIDHLYVPGFPVNVEYLKSINYHQVYFFIYRKFSSLLKKTIFAFREGYALKVIRSHN